MNQWPQVSHFLYTFLLKFDETYPMLHLSNIVVQVYLIINCLSVPANHYVTNRIDFQNAFVMEAQRIQPKPERGPIWHAQSQQPVYHCPRCNAGYTYKKTLMTHMRYDCGKEPRFKCPYCQKRDKCSSNIYKHVRMKHRDMPVKVQKS